MSEQAFALIGTICDSKREFNEIAQEVCSALRSSLKTYNWVGIYMVEDKTTLVLKAWDGPAATEHVRIPVGEGICGAAAQNGKTIIVDDVNKDPRYLQCFLNTKAEIVVPIYSEEKVVGEIDIDSDVTAAFGETDQIFLEWIASKLGEAFAREATAKS